MSSTNEIDSDKLPHSLESTIMELLDPRKLLITKGLKQPKGAADYFSYKITIRKGNKDHIIECNEIQMNDSIKSLVSYVQKKSEKKSR